MALSKYVFCYCLLLALCLSGCSRTKSNTAQPEINKYIYGYTSGTITSNAHIYIYLDKTPDKSFPIGEPLPGDLLKISPAIKGQLFLKEERILEFIPQQGFTNGQEYRLRLHLGALFNVPSDYNYFEFSVKVVDLQASFNPGNFTTTSSNDTLNYQASLYTSDHMESQEIEKQVTAQIDNQSLPIEWSHSGNTHHFTVYPILKTEQPQTLTLRFGNKVINQKEFQENIPGNQQFSVLNVQLNDNDRQSLRIDLSENVDPSQNLEGLITIQGVSDIRYKTNANTIFLFYTIQEDAESIEVTVHKGIRSSENKILEEPYTQTVYLPSSNPAIRFIGEGIIVPSEGKVWVPFSAVALKAVDVQIIKVFDQNMNFFLQQNSYDGTGDLIRTARPVFRQKIALNPEGSPINLNHWNDFTLNLSDLVKLEKGVIYRIEIRFRKSYTTLDCASEGQDNTDYYDQDWDGNDYYYSNYYYNNDYRWSDRDNPCTDSYYTGDRFISKNIINTSLGILAKRGSDNRYFVAVNDIVTAAPVANCMISLYNYQNQKIDSVQTDKNGFAYLNTDMKAFIAQARKGQDKAWLKISDANSLSLSNFDISGQDVQSGLKGFIYGERGVWRPGNDIYLSFILEDKQHLLPAGHPIIAQLIDPKGNTTATRKSVTGDIPIHTFRFSTAEDAPTGYWKCVVQIGGNRFTKTLRIETIKPNRLSINMIFPNEQVVGKGISNSIVKVKTRWLNGASTPNRKAITEVKLNRSQYTFKNYPAYTFNSLTDDFEPYSATLFDGKTDSEGNFSFNLNEIKTENAPGILNATFTTRVFEESGDFSIATYTTHYSPYTRYAGIRLPDSEDGWYPTTENVKLSGVLVTPLGQKAPVNTTVEIQVYKIEWRWWWDSENNNYTYINRPYNSLLIDKTIRSKDGKFECELNIEHYGRYYIQATDKESGHSTGLVAYFGSWAENSSKEAATILNITTDKKNYKAGEKVQLTIPSSQQGIAIVSLENGTSFRDIHRIQTTENSTRFEFEATPAMCPNIYVFVTLIQPQQNRDNDRPIRLYGMVNINIEDAALHLYPEIKLKPDLRPGEEFTVTVSEKEHRAMDYTLAVVDEGLLSLTSFRTPQPFPAFYAREALGVKTWDFYDYIFGAYGARLEKAFAIGGDEVLKPEQDEKTNRFKPVVLFEGPFSLKKGESRTHKLRMPEYIGEVRAMVVAATADGKYGSASADAQVNKPLMLSVAMPRLFTPGDVMNVPVTVFAMNNSIRNVEVQMTTDDKLEIVGKNIQTVTFTEQGEKLAWFTLRVKQTTGNTALTFTAQSGKETTVVKENVQIRVPNPRMTHVSSEILKPEKSVKLSAKVEGADPLSTLEISTIPPLNLAERLQELITYPHGCAEQIVSTAFPQISLNTLLDLTPKQKMDIETNVKAVISRLSLYQTADGGFAYWPGSPYVSEWVSTYVAHFLISASRKGYSVPTQLLQKDLNYLQSYANSYRINNYYDEIGQGYRLYVLALAGKPNLPAMNRMKERKLQNATAQWLLASAYALCNHPDIARKLIQKASREVSPYRQTGGTFGSDIRDKAIILQSMIYLGMQDEAYQMLEQISAALSSNNWLSTQTTAFALLAATEYVAKFVGNTDGLKAEIQTQGQTINIQTNKTFQQEQLTIRKEESSASVKNTGTNTLYIRLITSSAPYQVVTEQILSGLSMNIRYYDDKGQSVDINNLLQGTDVTAKISVRNTGMTGTYDNLALTYLLPSGFEIINDRLTGNTQAFKDTDYVNIRDDGYDIYFSLNQNQTKTFEFRFNAAFAGDYLRPAIQCSAMYDDRIQAVLPGGKTVIRQE